MKNRGWVAFLDKHDILPGDKLSPSLAKNIRKASAFVLVASPEAGERSWVRREIELAIDARRPIVPIDIGGRASLLSSLGDDRVYLNEDSRSITDGPTPAVIAELERRFTFTRRRTRLRALIAMVVAAFLALAGSSIAYYILAASRGVDASVRRDIAHLLNTARQQGEPELAALLAVEAAEVRRRRMEPIDMETLAALSDSVAALGSRTLKGIVEDVHDLSVSPDKRWLVAQHWHDGGSLAYHIFDMHSEDPMASRRWLHEVPASPHPANWDDSTRRPMWNGTGRGLVVHGPSGATAWLDVAGNLMPLPLPHSDTALHHATWNSTGTTFAAFRGDDSAMAWNFDNDGNLTSRGPYSFGLGMPSEIHIDPTGRWMLMVGSSRFVLIQLGYAGTDHLQRVVMHRRRWSEDTNNIDGFVFSPDGRWLAACEQGPYIKDNVFDSATDLNILLVWDLGSDRAGDATTLVRPGAHFAHSSVYVDRIEFSSDSKLARVSSNGAQRMWILDGFKEVPTSDLAVGNKFAWPVPPPEPTAKHWPTLAQTTMRIWGHGGSSTQSSDLIANARHAAGREMSPMEALLFGVPPSTIRKEHLPFPLRLSATRR